MRISLHTLGDGARVRSFWQCGGWRQVLLPQSDASRRYTLRDTALSAKHVLRQGSLWIQKEEVR
jgi:hypothetical protein